MIGSKVSLNRRFVSHANRTFGEFCIGKEKQFRVFYKTINKKMSIAITGAAGQLGKIVVTRLIEKGYTDKIVALVRNLEKAAGLGVRTVYAEYEDPASLKSALEGVQTLLLISANEVGKRANQHKNIINAAKDAGVLWIVYTSLLHADTTTLNLAPEHLETEAAIRESGIAYTILRNGWYTENYTGFVAGAVLNGAFIGSAGAGKLSLAARKDYAEAAVAVLSTEGHQGKVYELAGDLAYTLTDLAAEVSKQTGKEIPYENIPENEYADKLEKAGLPPVWANGIASWDTAASRNDLFDDTKQLSQLIGRPTTPLPETVSIVLATN